MKEEETGEINSEVIIQIEGKVLFLTFKVEQNTRTHFFILYLFQSYTHTNYIILYKDKFSSFIVVGFSCIPM